MAQYSIGDIEELTGIKAHILRYWEEIIPSFAPKKDLGGRRMYTQRDLDIIQRLKYLIYEKKFTIEGARDFLISDIDIASSNACPRGTIQVALYWRPYCTGSRAVSQVYRRGLSTKFFDLGGEPRPGQ